MNYKNYMHIRYNWKAVHLKNLWVFTTTPYIFVFIDNLVPIYYGVQDMSGLAKDRLEYVNKINFMQKLREDYAGSYEF